MAQWSTAFINDLPDSSFAYIESGGEKDSDGKTTPRSLRHLPYKDAAGKVDHNHAANALARLDQTQGIPAGEKAAIRSRLQHALGQTNNDVGAERFTFSATALALNGAEPPSRIPLLVTGNWPNSVKGDFSVDLDDLRQIKENFDAGRGFPTNDASTGLAIDFEHNYSGPAAAWIKGLELAVDPNDATRGTLYANPVEWSAEGAAAVQSGKYKMISPSGYFGKHSGKLAAWPNPQNLKETVPNVLDGAGLTNIPFLRTMAPVRADKAGQNASANLIYIYDVRQKEQISMSLDELRVKDREALSVPELDYLSEHKNELSAEEAKKFKLDAEGEGDNKDGDVSDEDRATLDAIKKGEKKVVDNSVETVEKSRLDSLEKTALDYRTEKAEGIVEAHVKRGAIKQDKSEYWTKQLLNADGQERKDMEAALESLPSNEQLSKEQGTGEDVNAGATARESLTALANKMVADASKAGKELLFADALKKAYRENPDLKKQDNVEMGIK